MNKLAHNSRVQNRDRSIIKDLIYPIFVIPGMGKREEIKSLPRYYYFSQDLALAEVSRLQDLGLDKVIVYAKPESLDLSASSAFTASAIVPEIVHKLKSNLKGLKVICDLCLCQYMSHAQCGFIGNNGEIDQERTQSALLDLGLRYAQVGADYLMPSSMSEELTAKLKQALKQSELSHVGLISQNLKFASALFNPFRKANHAQTGCDKSSYQIEPANAREFLRAANRELADGADFLCVKPSMFYLDIIHKLRTELNCQILAFSPSGEYTLGLAISQQQSDLDFATQLFSNLKRAGANWIFSYWSVPYVT